MAEGKATIPHLAEKLTNELVKHILVSNRGPILSCSYQLLPKIKFNPSALDCSWISSLYARAVLNDPSTQ